MSQSLKNLRLLHGRMLGDDDDTALIVEAVSDHEAAALFVAHLLGVSYDDAIKAMKPSLTDDVEFYIFKNELLTDSIDSRLATDDVLEQEFLKIGEALALGKDPMQEQDGEGA